MLAAGKKQATDGEQVALLLTIGGEELLDVYNSFEFPAPTEAVPAPQNVLADVLEKFDTHFAPRKNELAARWVFRETKQNNDTLDTFITKLKIRAKDCNFGDQRDKMLRDQIVFGCREGSLRDKCFEKGDELTLDDTLKLCISHQASTKQKVLIKGEEAEMTIHKIQPTRQASKDKDSKPTKLRECKFCGQKHYWNKFKCPAFGSTCSKCGKKNHFESKCPKLKTKQEIHAVKDESGSDCESEVEYVLNVNSETDSMDKKIMAHMEVGGTQVKFQVDSGASVNVIPRKCVPDVELSPCNSTLSMWNVSTINPVGKCRTVVKNCKNNKKYSVEFIVVEEFTPLLGKRASEQMGLITVNYENISNVCDLSMYDVFSEELGTLPGKVHLTLEENVKPVAISSCRMPINLKTKIKQKLDEMTEQGVIAQVDDPTEWVSRMAVSSKRDGGIRICIDPQALNNALMREMHPLPLIDDILPELINARLFSKFDLSNGYWHCVLDEESSVLTTFQTPFGKFRWKRLPFGLSVSSEIFQKRLHTSLEGLEGVICVADDILVFGVGASEEEARRDHDNKVTLMLERCQKHGIRLNKDKTELRKTEITFLGHKITNKGLMIDPSKTEAIVKMEAPKDLQGVQTCRDSELSCKISPTTIRCYGTHQTVNKQEHRVGMGL